VRALGHRRSVLRYVLDTGTSAFGHQGRRIPAVGSIRDNERIPGSTQGEAWSSSRHRVCACAERHVRCRAGVLARAVRRAARRTGSDSAARTAMNLTYLARNGAHDPTARLGRRSRPRQWGAYGQPPRSGRRTVVRFTPWGVRNPLGAGARQRSRDTEGMLENGHRWPAFRCKEMSASLLDDAALRTGRLT